MLSDFKSLSRPLSWVDEKILHFLIINFNHGYCNLVALIFVSVSSDSLEDLFASHRHYAFVSTVTYH